MSTRFTVFQNRSDTEGTITLTTHTLLHLLHIHDSAFPIGGYTHTFGMETYIQNEDIRDRQSLLTYLRHYLFYNLVPAEAVIMREAYRLTKREDWEQLRYLDQRCHAMKIAQESRQGSQKMGRQFLMAVSALSSDQAMAQWLRWLKNGRVKGHLAICYGMYAARIGLDESVAIVTFLYTSLVSLVHNAVRAIPLGQQDGMMVIHALASDIEKVVPQVEGYLVDEISNKAPGVELASMQHAFLYSRLFIS